MGSRFSAILKWVGYITAILSLIAGLRELEKVIAGRIEARKQISALLASEQIQLKARDYPSAWKSLEQASQVDPESAPVHLAQETLAMAWLENIQVHDNQRFSDITEKLEPVLTRGVASEKNASRQADLMAHLGWSYFLRSREGSADLDPAATYAEAVKKDQHNPYAQSMWGHWILWNGGEAAEASRHFASALESSRERDFVRGLQLSALLNANTVQRDVEVVRVVNAIRKEGGSIDPDMKRRIFSVYYLEIMPSNSDTPLFVNAVPAAEHVTTFHWLFDNLDLNSSNSLPKLGYLSVLQEAAGERAEALAGYQSIRQQMAGHSGSLVNIADAGIKRLSGNR